MGMHSVLICIYGFKCDSELNLSMIEIFKSELLQHTFSSVLFISSQLATITPFLVSNLQVLILHNFFQQFQLVRAIFHLELIPNFT